MTMIFVAVFAMMIVVLTSSCGGDERRAERLWRRAIERMEKGETQAAVDDLQKIITTYPDARIATKAREQIVVYRGLATAVQSYPMRRARELMIQLARAVESRKRQHRETPASLDVLVPGVFVSVPVDPWGRPFIFEATARGYRLRCLGADGAPGGDGDGADLSIVDGAFTASSR